MIAMMTLELFDKTQNANSNSETPHHVPRHCQQFTKTLSSAYVHCY